MSKTQISFQAKVKIGEEIVPIKSEIVRGSDSADGVQNGFLFKLDIGPDDPPVLVDLGAIVGFIESKLGSSALAGNPGVNLLSQAFPGTVTSTNFNSQNTTMVEIKSFEINSSDKQTLFSFSMNVEGSDPGKGFVPLPAELSSWLRIDSLAISMTATKPKS